MYEIKKIVLNDMPLYMPLDLIKKHGIIICFTTREGGCSKGNFSSLNVSYHVNDNNIDVEMNRKKIFNSLRLKQSGKIFCGEQVHKDNIYVFNSKEKINRIINNMAACNNNTAIKDNIIDVRIPQTDGLVTSLKNIPIMVMGADCNLILISDIKRKIIAAVHAGWKGTLKKIVVKTLNLIIEEFKSKKKDILVYFGPSIRECCYSVSEPELTKFINIFGNGNFYRKVNKKNVTKNKYGRKTYYFMDLVKINYTQLLNFGISPQNIFDCNKCTCCEDSFFSYRRDKVTGRQAAIASVIG